MFANKGRVIVYLVLMGLLLTVSLLTVMSSAVAVPLNSPEVELTCPPV